MSNANFVCEKCSKPYKTKRGYDQHVLTHEIRPAAGSNVSGEPQVHQCPHCFRTYKTLRNFEKHQLTHLQTGVSLSSVPSSETVLDVADDESVELWPEEAIVDEPIHQNILFEEEDEEQERLILAAMMGVTLDNPQTAATSAVAPEKNKPNAKTPLALCSSCGKGYMTLEGYIKHRMSHAMADAVAKAPSLEEMQEGTKRCAKDVLKKILSCNVDPKTKIEIQLHMCATKMLDRIESEKVIEFLCSLCDGLYACFIRKDKFLLPSHLREEYLKCAAVLFSNKVKRDELRKKLVSALELNDEESDIDFFLTSVMRQISIKLLAFIAHWLAHGKDSPIVLSESLYSSTHQLLDSTDFKQIIHYSAGSNVKSILRCAWRRWGQNDDSKLVVKVLRENFLIGGPQDSPDKEFMAWTVCQDRGKLIKINDKALNFFLELAAVVQPLEHFDGSLIVNEVIEKFASYPKVISLWDDLIKDTLPKQLSFRLLHSMVTCFCNTWRSGIISRRIDEIQSKKAGAVLGTSGVSFRPKVVMSSNQKL